MNFYKRFIGDYQRDTAHLAMLEHGAYTALLDAYHATEKPLPRADAICLPNRLRAVTPSAKRTVHVRSGCSIGMRPQTDGTSIVPR